MKFSALRNPQAHSEIVEQICDAILRGELRKGDRLPSERQIAAETGISRTSVREAIRVLTEAGMFEVTPGWGGGTRLVSINMPPDLLGDPISGSLERLLEFYEARNVLETAAARLTALRATPAQIEELEQCVRDMEALVARAPHDYEAYFDIDSHFHRLVVKGAGNAILFDLYIPVMRTLWLLKDTIAVEDLHPYGLSSMQEFVAAVKAGDPDAASEAITAHVEPLLELMRQGYEVDPAAAHDAKEKAAG